MPRRKRASGDGGRRPKVCRVEHSEETLVISDSDNEEEEECSVGRSSRAVRLRQRECKSQLQEMTEDEMLDLAMKLSAQEASSAAQRRQLEDNDIQKAIAESLNASDRDGSVKASSSSAQPQESISSVISRLRRKLSYAHQTQVHSGKESTVAPADGPERESTSPLPEMPDLSQTTPSPSSSSAPVCGPLVLSNDTTPDIEPNIRDSKKDEFPQPVSSAQPSPGFPKDRSFIHQALVCVEKLSQDLIDASTGSREQPCTQDSIVGAEASPSQEDLSLTKSLVFTQNDLRERTDILEDKHDASDEKESLTQIPDEDLPTYQGDKGLSPKNTDLEECSSPSRKTQRSAERCEAENAHEDVTVKSKTTDLKQVEDQIAQDENLAADAESTQNTRSWEGFSSFMVVLLTDDDEEDDGSEEVLPPSPVLHGKTALKIVAQTQPCVSSSTLDPSQQDTQISQHALQEDSETSNDLKSKSSNSKSLHTGVERGDHCSVSYYWGVPFCPMGQNPDDYTRVIMCQLEVYEKSLKEARRDLLHKAEWSQPVLPASERPFGPRRLKRYRPPQLSEDEEQNEEESEKENKRFEVQEEREEDKTGSQGAAEGGQSETYVVLSSPEAKEEDVRKSPFPNQDKTTAATTHLRNDQWHAPDNTQIERAVEDEETQNQDQFDDEQTVCPETQLTDNNTPELMMTSPASPEQDKTRAESELMEVDEEEGTPAAEEDVMEQESVSADTAPSQTQQMECPMCSKLFCLSRIEMHAAFCDGETEDQNQEEQSQVVRRTRSRRDPTEETPYRPEKSPQMEKCFVCKGMFTSQQYQAHVELCLKKTDSNIHQAGGLLSALERTEQRPAVSEAGPSDVSSRSNRGPANLFGEGGPESEDTDQLSDFQQQESSKNSQRLARKRKYKR